MVSKGQKMETTHFTCMGKGHGAPVVPATLEEWKALRREPWLGEMCRRIARGEESLKGRLPVWTPSCAAFKDSHRAVADAQKPLRRIMLDFDQKGHSAEILERCMQLKAEGKWDILLVEESVRRGTHVLVALPPGMTPQEVQQRFSEDVGFQADPALKDVARCIYMVPQDFTLYMDEESLANPIPLEADDAGEEVASEAGEKAVAGGGEREYPPLEYEELVQVLEEQMGGLPSHGSRNNFIFSMACHLRYVCNDDPEWIARVLPTYGESREKWMATIRSACNRHQTPAMPRIMQRTIEICKSRRSEAEQPAGSPPPMPRVLPPLIRLLVSRTPEIYRPAVAHAVFPALGAHLWKTTFRYIDNVAHEATLMNVLMAGTGAGKNCICEPINRIMKDIRQRDAENMRRELEWKREMQTRGANKDKRQRPEGLVVQEIDPDMTNAAFVQRLADADERFLYARMNEIDQFDALKGSMRAKGQFQVMCLAFDPGNVYGQTRISLGSVSERVCIRFNWNASTTIQKGRRYFRQVLTDGPISRINFCTIPEREIGAEMPVYGSYDEGFDEELRPYIERLNNARGLVECVKARNLSKKLVEECADFARLSQSRVYENLSYRANVIAFLKAMVLYVAQGEKWDKTLENFIRWSLQYDMWCKMQFFGKEIEQADYEECTRAATGPQNMLDLLPDTFTREDAQRMRQQMGIERGSLKQMLANWRHRGYIAPVVRGEELPDSACQLFAKTEDYLRRK